MSDQIVTTEEALISLGFKSKPDDFPTIKVIVTAIDKLIKTYCGRCFNQEVGAVEYLDGDGDTELWLEDYPVSSVVLYIKTDDDVEFDDVQDLVDEDDYVVYPDTGRIYCAAGFVTGHRNIKVVYTRGYSDADMPEDLKTLVFKAEVKNFYNRWTEDSGNLKSYALAGIKKTFHEEGLSPLSIMILDGSYTKKRM